MYVLFNISIVKHIDMLTIKFRNLLDAQEEYIVQQCNCIGTRTNGLSRQIALRFPHADPYRWKHPLTPGGFIAIQEDRHTPGEIEVLGDKSKGERPVICMFAQVGPGRPYSTCNSTGIYGIDNHDARSLWFARCLENIVKEVNPSSLAFPYGIGCGLAGGDWQNVYNPILQRFSQRHHIAVVLYLHQDSG